MPELPGPVSDAGPSFETSMPGEDPCASEEALPACVHTDAAAQAGYPEFESAGERYGPDRLPPTFRSAAPLEVDEGGVATRLARVRAPSPEISPESMSAGHPIRLADMGGLRGGAGGAKTQPAPDAHGTESGMSPPAGDSAGSSDRPAGDDQDGDDQGGDDQGGADQGSGGEAGGGEGQDVGTIPGAGTHPDVPNPNTDSNPGSNTEEPKPEQDTDTDTNDEPGHGVGHPPVPTYPDGPFDPERPPVQVPEPGTLGLLIAGLLGCAARRRTARRAGSSADHDA